MLTKIVRAQTLYLLNLIVQGSHLGDEESFIYCLVITLTNNRENVQQNMKSQYVDNAKKYLSHWFDTNDW